MYLLKATIKCPNRLKESFINRLEEIGVKEIEVSSRAYGDFILESRLYWDYVYPEMLDEEKDVTYISFCYDDSEEGHQAMHDAEWHIGWVPLNIRYIRKEDRDVV